MPAGSSLSVPSRIVTRPARASICTKRNSRSRPYFRSTTDTEERCVVALGQVRSCRLSTRPEFDRENQEKKGKMAVVEKYPSPWDDGGTAPADYAAVEKPEHGTFAEQLA